MITRPYTDASLSVPWRCVPSGWCIPSDSALHCWWRCRVPAVQAADVHCIGKADNTCEPSELPSQKQHLPSHSSPSKLKLLQSHRWQMGNIIHFFIVRAKVSNHSMLNFQGICCTVKRKPQCKSSIGWAHFNSCYMTTRWDDYIVQTADNLDYF